MKKTVSLIYRFIFLLFGVWGICQHIGYNLLNMSIKMYDFIFVVDVMSFICIISVFVASIKGGIGRVLQTFKNILTFCSIMILAKNFLYADMSYEWTLGVLLPLMMVIDWLLFDKKGNLNFYDPLLWLLGACLLLGILGFLFDRIFGVDDFWKSIGLFSDVDELIKLALTSLGLGVFIFIVDSIINAFKKKSFSKIFALIYRLFFIALEVYAFVKLTGTRLQDFLFSLQYYLTLTNFLCVICICVLIVYNLIKFKSIRKSQNPFPVLKGALTVAILSSMMATFMFGKSVLTFSFAEMILNYIAPFMMLFDWILFDYKGNIEVRDPLIWASIPMCYYIIALIFPNLMSAYPGIYNSYDLKLIAGIFITVISVGYIIYIFDRILERKQ